MDINRDQVVVMFGRFEASALASFVAAAENAIGAQAVDLDHHFNDLLEMIELARQAGHANVGAVDFEVMVKEPIRRHGLTGHELCVLFTVDRIAHAADLLVEPNVIDYIVTLHDTGINDDEVTRVSIHKLRATTDHAAWIEAHRLAEHFMSRLHTVSRVVEPITVRGAEVVGDALELGEFREQHVDGPGLHLHALQTTRLSASAILAWLDKHEPGPEWTTVEDDPHEYVLMFARCDRIDEFLYTRITFLYTRITSLTSYDAIRVARTLAGRYSLQPVRIRHTRTDSITEITKHTSSS